MSKKTILALVIGLVVGIAGTVGVSALTKESDPKQPASTDHSTLSMADMNKELEKRSGDDYDKTFIEMMIAHHEGAVDMAQLSNSRAKHDEIKQLSQAIIAAQEKEISDMKKWQADWGYNATGTTEMMHGSH